MGREYFYNDDVFTFEGAVSVESNGNEVSPWRLDYPRIRFFPVLKDDKGGLCSGVRLCFTTDSKNVILKFAAHDHEIKLDVFINDALHEKITMPQGGREAALKTGADGEKRYAIWLDHRHKISFLSVTVDDGSFIRKTIVREKRWVHYGSSISQAKEADSPSAIWPSITARKNNLHLVNLGFGGQCKIDSMIAFMIGNLPCDLITLKLGINVYMGDLTHRTFLPSILGFVKIIREKKPDVPLVLISPIFSPPREEINSPAEHVSLKDMRSYVSEATEIFRFYGDKNIYYSDGLKIFGPENAEYMPDDLHPNAEGQPVLAENFEREVFKLHGLI